MFREAMNVATACSHDCGLQPANSDSQQIVRACVACNYLGKYGFVLKGMHGVCMRGACMGFACEELLRDIVVTGSSFDVHVGKTISAVNNYKFESKRSMECQSY